MATHLLDPILPHIKKVNYIDDQPLGAQTASRNRVITTIQVTARQAWFFSLNLVTEAMSYDDYRDFIEDMRATNFSQPFSFSLASAPERLKARYAYRGSLDETERTQVVTASYTAGSTSLTLSGLPVGRVGAFRKNDLIEVNGAVRTILANADVTPGGNATLTLSAPFRTPPSAGSAVRLGADVIWQNCYFPTPPQFGVSSEISHNSVVMSNNDLTFNQSST